MAWWTIAIVYLLLGTSISRYTFYPICLFAFWFVAGSSQAEKKCVEDYKGDSWLGTASFFDARPPSASNFGSAIDTTLDSFLGRIPFFGKILLMIQRFVVNIIVFFMQQFQPFSFAATPNVAQLLLSTASSLFSDKLFDLAAMFKENEPCKHEMQGYSSRSEDLEFEDDAGVRQRIIGGQPSSPHEFPYQIALFENGRFICGGSILSPWYVLTAGHCVHK